MTAPAHPIFVALGATPADAAAQLATSVLSTSTGTPIMAVTTAGGLLLNTTNLSDTPGAATINKPSGKVAIALGAASVVVTNSLVTTSSTVLCQLQTTDATLLYIKSVIPAAGSFTITGNAVSTAAVTVAFFVLN